MTVREKKPTITATHPGSADVAKAMGWSVIVARVVADLPGCPRVSGGRGKRFSSVEAFRAWFDALPAHMKLKVPEINHSMRSQLACEIAKLTWQGPDAHASLARAHTYDELLAMRDYWREHAKADRRPS